MSDQAPERIWADQDSPRYYAYHESRTETVEYRRADIAWLPGELVERAKYAIKCIDNAHPTEHASLHLVEGSVELFRDILAALENPK